MKITMITSSAHRHGTTMTLTDQFIRGAEEAGHELFRFDAGFQNVHPCIGCDKCSRTGTCAFEADDMKLLNPHLLEADALVFVSPIYYYTINAQLKTVIDRFYANNAALQGGKKALLITAMADTGMESALCANSTFCQIAKYMKWEPAGTLNICGAYVAADLREEDLQRAYELGKNLC